MFQKLLYPPCYRKNGKDGRKVTPSFLPFLGLSSVPIALNPDSIGRVFDSASTCRNLELCIEAKCKMQSLLPEGAGQADLSEIQIAKV